MRGLWFIAQLVVAETRAQPMRAWLTCLAIVASSAAIVWVVSGYDALVANFDENARKYLGRYDLVIVPADLPFGAIAPLPDELIESVRRDPGVREVNPVAQSRATITRVDAANGAGNAIEMLVGSRPPVNGAPPLDPMLVATPAEEEPYELVEGRWLSDKASAMEAVLSAGAAERLGIEVDAQILVTTISNRRPLKVVGIVEEPADAPNFDALEGPTHEAPALGDESPAQAATAAAGPRQAIGIPAGAVNTPAVEAVYVRPPVADELNGYPAKVNLLQVALRERVSPGDFREAWAATFEQSQPKLTMLEFEAVRSGMKGSYSVSTELTQAYSATALAAVASTFIIFTTLSMGVAERAKQVALLRAIALTRRQVGAMIVIESLLLAVIGWVGGLAAGQVILWIAAAARPEFFATEAVLGWTGVLFAGLSVLAGALGAAVIPAWHAMRIRPLDAVAVEESNDVARWPWICLIVGLGLMVVPPLSVFQLSVDKASRTRLYAVVSNPALLIGVVLIAPGLTLACQRWVAPLLARGLRLSPPLLSSQLESNFLRTLGATLALTSGLALYASTQIWGQTMLQHYLPGKWLPDALAAFHPMGLDDGEIDVVRQVPGIQADEALPLAIEQAKFAWSEQNAPAGLRRDNAIVVGLDVQRAFGGADPLLKLDFVQGDREELVGQLRGGDKCVVSEEFVTLTGLSVGDRIPFSPPNAPQQVVEYEIAGVVATPGWQWVTKFSGVRRHFVRTFTMLFADEARVRSDFHLTSNEFFWLNLDGTRSIAEVEKSLQTIAERHAGGRFDAGDYGQVTAHRPFARLTATDTVHNAISMVADEVIWGMSKLPLITLGITSVAVANTIAASVRARRWQLGVLRAVGITRSQIVRLILAEAMMIAIVACLLSLAFGVIAGWCSVGMSRYTGIFYSPADLFIPWQALALGGMGTLLLSLAAAMWPAVAISRARPLQLLQEC